MRQRVTVKDVAEYAGVSTATVSNVITGKKYVSPDVVQKVKEGMDSLGYKVNVIARSLKVNKSFNIGLMVPDISNPFFAEIVKNIERETKKYHYQIILCDSDNSAEKEEAILRTFMTTGVDGIINVAPRMTERKLNVSWGVPMVVIDRPSFETEEDIAFVYADNYKGAAEVAKHFVKCGYEEFICLTGETGTVPNARLRKEGFLKELIRAGIPEMACEVHTGDFSFESGKSIMQGILESYDPSRPKAVFISNDMMAWGSMEAIQAKKLKIPRDIAVVGFDNIYLSEFFYPKLTTVENSTRELGHYGARFMLDALSDTETAGFRGKQIVLKASLVKRASG